MTTSGIHAGNLFYLGEKSAICFVDDRGAKSPLDNPKILESISKTENLVFQFLAPTPYFVALLQENLNTFAKGLDSEYKPEEIEVSINRLEALLQRSQVALPKKGGSSSIYMTKLLAQLIYVCLFPDHKALQIQRKAESLSKRCTSFMTESEMNYFMNEVFTFLTKIDLSYSVFKEILTNPTLIQYAQDTDQIAGLFWDRGDFIGSTSSPTPNSFAEIAKKLLSDPTKALLFFMQMKQLVQKCEAILVTVGTRIDQFIKKNPNTLFVFAGYNEIVIKRECVRLKIEMVGPIKEAIKPRGFFFELTKANKVVGYLLGSIHPAPQKILDQITSEAFKAFATCSILTIESDPTNLSLKRKAFEFFVNTLKNEEKLELEHAFEQFLKSANITPPKDPHDLVEALLLRDAYIKKWIPDNLETPFIDQAKQRSMEIVSLESIENHTNSELTGSTLTPKEILETQIVLPFLKDALEKISKPLVEIIETALIQKLDHLFNSQSAEQKGQLNRRNIEMATTYDRQIQSGKIPFGLVGCMHFAGPFGVQRLLEGMGYTVTQILPEEKL